MTYSLDLRNRVVAFIRNGGSKAAAADIFSIHRDTVYDWDERDKRLHLEASAHPNRHRKIDKDKLRQHVVDHPDAILRERSIDLNASVSAISRMMNTLKISCKKNSTLRRKGS